MTTRSTRSLAYTIESQQIGGVLRGFVVTKCSGCNQPFKVQWPGHQNPHHIGKHFRRLGWDFNAHRQTGNKCPTCNQPKHVAGISNTPIDLHTFGGRIQYMREKTHLTPEVVAAQAKIPLVLLQQIEGGTHLRYGLDAAIPIRLADVFARHGASVDANWLNGSGESDTPLAMNLRRLMNNNHHTEGSLAAAAHVAPSLIRRILSGSIEECYAIDKIAQALSCRVETLTGKPAPVQNAAEALFQKSHNGRVLPALPAPNAALEKPPERRRRESHINGSSFATDKLAKVFFGKEPSQWLKDLREQRSLTQLGLAKQIKEAGGLWVVGATQAMISEIERGANISPARQLLLDLAQKVAEPNVAESQSSSTEVVDSAALKTALESARSELAEIRKLLDDLEPLRQLYNETVKKIDGIEKALQAIPETNQTAHLKCIHGHWFFRRHVPKFAIEAFGCREYQVSLGTSDRDEAIARKAPHERAFTAKLMEAKA